MQAGGDLGEGESHRPEYLRRVPQHRDISEAVTAQRERHRQISDDLAGVVGRARLGSAVDLRSNDRVHEGDHRRD